mgnify:CR=1 FL=1
MNVYSEVTAHAYLLLLRCVTEQPHAQRVGSGRNVPEHAMAVGIGHCGQSGLLNLYHCARQILLAVFLYHVYGHRVSFGHRLVFVGTHGPGCAESHQRKH